ncbi:M-phase phosphoprotein 6, partial [Globisporangium splendens]
MSMWKPGSSKPAGESKTPAAATANAAPAASGGADNKRPTSKSALSQKTLAMKFMQRKKQAEVRKQNAAQIQKKQDTWIVDSPEDDDANNGGGASIVCTPDVRDPSLPLIFGRRSFGGFNKAVEDEYREVSRQQRFAASEEKELREEVSAEEMAARMIKYTGLMRGGGGNSKNRSQKRQRK